jgi:hypothetical protein
MLTAYTDASVESVIKSREIDSKYNPNPAGYFSHGSMFAPIADWIADTPDNSVMKAAPEAFLNGAGTEPLKVILTNRPQPEIETSFMKAFGMDVPEFRYTARVEAENILKAAENVDLTVIDFADLIADPTAVFTDLAANKWPIDIDKAAKTIDPTLYRNK